MGKRCRVSLLSVCVFKMDKVAGSGGIGGGGVGGGERLLRVGFDGRRWERLSVQCCLVCEMCGVVWMLLCVWWCVSCCNSGYVRSFYLFIHLLYIREEGHNISVLKNPFSLFLS